MKQNQLNRGLKRRIMYIESMGGKIYGADARVGWVTFSKSGKSVHYKEKTFTRLGGRGIRGNYYDTETGEEYWISGVKVKGSNNHWSNRTGYLVDMDAVNEYNKIRA